MLLTIFNLPVNARYTDVKSLLQEKCGLSDFILDNLIVHKKGKKVTVGLADEEDAAILVRKINGLYVNGQQLYVEDSRKKRESDQPYRASTSIGHNSQYQDPMVNPHHNGMGESMVPVMNNPMMMNYNMMPIYMPMMPMEQNVPYMGYDGSQVVGSMDPNSMVPVHRPVGFQGEGAAPSNRPREQGRDTFRHSDRNRNPTPERPADFNRRWNEKPASIEAPVRRQRSPPDQRWAPRETNQAPCPPFGIRNPERPGRRNQDLYSPRLPEPEYRPMEPRGEPLNTRWGPEPNPPRPEPDQNWTGGPNQNWQPEPIGMRDEPNRRRMEPNPRRVEPNPQWEGDSRRHERDYPPMERFQQNERHIDQGHPLGQYQNEPDFHRREHSFPDVRDRESQHPEADWNNGNNRWDKNRGPNNSGRETTYRRGPAPSLSRRDNQGPKPSGSNTYEANERRDERRPNPPKRNHSEREGGGPNWSQIANDYPPSKKPRDNLVKRGFEEPRQKLFAPKENTNTNFRPGVRAPFRSDSAAPRFTHPSTLPIRPFKPPSVTSLINKDQTCRGQATATLAKQAMAGSTIGDPLLSSRILKELKLCIKGRIDVMLGEELSFHIDNVITRYRQKFPKKDDRSFYQMIRDKCLYHQNKQEASGEGNLVAAVNPEDTESKVEEEVKKEEPTFEKKEDIKEEKVPQNVTNHPQTDKQIVKEQKIQHKLEFNREDYFRLDPIMDTVLDEELEKLTDIFASECDNPIDDVDEAICGAIKKGSAAEFKKVVRIHVTKRILDIHTGLAVRIFSPGKLPKKSVVKEYLRGLRIDRLTVIKNKKGTMYVANLGSFEQYDHLCRLGEDLIDGVQVKFRSMHLVGPPPKVSKNQLKQRRKKFIQSQIYPTNPEEELIEDNLFKEDTLDFLEGGKEFKDEFDNINISSIKDEDLVDF